MNTDGEITMVKRIAFTKKEFEKLFPTVKSILQHTGAKDVTKKTNKDKKD